MTNQLANDMTGHVAIAGHRSFISQALERELWRSGKRVFPLCKASLGIDDLSGFDCVYLVLGRAKPTADEALGERNQLADFLGNPRKPRRAVYVSSMSMSESKLWCETKIREYGVRGPAPIPIDVIRPGAVFGPNQDPDSRMLIPSMIRGGDGFTPDWPFLLTKFISVGDLAAFMANFSNPTWWNLDRAGEPDSACEIPGTFTMTPHQVHELYRTFVGLTRPGIDVRQAFLAGIEHAESGDIARHPSWDAAADAFMQELARSGQATPSDIR